MTDRDIDRLRAAEEYYRERAEMHRRRGSHTDAWICDEAAADARRRIADETYNPYDGH